MPTVTVKPSEDECTVILNPGEASYNGSDLAPGSVICLNAGSYSRLEFRNLKGTADKVITIRNWGGQVVVAGTNPVYFSQCEYVRFTGTGVATEQYGIKITGAKLQIRNLSTAFELDHIESQARFDIKDTEEGHERQELNELSIHHNYFHDIDSEAVYIGSSGYDEHSDIFVMRHIEVANNKFLNVSEAVQVGSVVEDCAIHHNYIYDANPMDEQYTYAAIMINPGSDCDVYNNTVIDSGGPGIIGNDEHFSHNIYNNLIVNVGHTTSRKDGILIFGDNYTVYNNTIVGTERYGIHFSRSEGSAFNNVILETVDDPIQKGDSPAADFHHNLTKDDGYTPMNFGFVDPVNGDYHLTESSPAVDAGADAPLDFDLDDKSRPVGAFDVGAYEFGSMPLPVTTPTP